MGGEASWWPRRRIPPTCDLCLGFAGCVQLGALAAGESATRAVNAEASRCPARLPAVDFGLGIELAGSKTLGSSQSMKRGLGLPQIAAAAALRPISDAHTSPGAKARSTRTAIGRVPAAPAERPPDWDAPRPVRDCGLRAPVPR